MEKSINVYKDIRKQLNAFKYAMTIISWDSSTEAPKGCFEDRGNQVGVLSELEYKLKTSNEFVSVVNELFANKENLDELMKHEIEVVKKEMDATLKIPMKEFIEFQVLMASSQEIWAQSKEKNDFNLFKPTLSKIVDFMRKYVKYLETDKVKGYDVLLDNYEPKFSTKEYDEFFELLKEKLVPFFKKVANKKLDYNSSFNNLTYDRNKQKIYCEYLMDVLCFDRNHGLMKESVHPFTTGTGTSDVRFTVNYHEDDFTSAFFSAIHELGHAIYEQQIDPTLNETFMAGGASMGIHESQSRMFENMIGRSYEFWETHFPKLKEIFSDNLKDVTVDDFYKFVNNVEASFIRIEADELSYPLHIMLRYDLERALINKEIEVDNLEEEWNKLFYQYFGLKVSKANDGVLQDVHWSGGMFGYFPTYALGSAYAAQIYHHMDKEININEVIKTKTTKQINEWLKNKIHKFGASLYPKEIIKIATNEDFNPEYYVNYLIEKYSKIFNI